MEAYHLPDGPGSLSSTRGTSKLILYKGVQEGNPDFNEHYVASSLQNLSLLFPTKRDLNQSH